MLINSITKKYSGSVALKELSFDFKQGEIVGLVGRNGAGKSTAFSVISGISTATKGDVFICKKSNQKK